jgi:hypothetical protein
MAWNVLRGLGALCVAAAAGGLGYLVGQEAPTAEAKFIPSSRFFYVQGQAPNRYVTFRGTWELDGPEKAAFKKQVVSYTCSEGEPYCTVSEATVFVNGLSVESSEVLASWSAGQLVLESADPMDCRRNSVVVDFRTEEVVSITQNGGGKAGCMLPPLDQPRKARLVDGFKRYFEEKYPDRKG